MANLMRCALPLLFLLAIIINSGCTADRNSRDDAIVALDVAVPMRDGVVLRADIYRPIGDKRFPVLVYRTPYGKHLAVEYYPTHRKAVARGYAVVLQDVRGRYASDGIFNPYRHEGQDGYDTIEWAAAQPWSNGDVGTFGLSYPGAVQWLAAIEAPPSLKAMVPAMTFSSPRNFFYANGVFDLSWLPWIVLNIAPDARIRQDLAGERTEDEARAAWNRLADEYLSHLPLGDLPFLREEAPYYFEWLRHPPEDSWWNWAEIETRYADVNAAVLNLSGWYDESYGPGGAIRNHAGLVASRRENGPARSHLIMGPWEHGVLATGESRTGELDFGPVAGIDYDHVILRFFDHYLRGIDGGLSAEAPINYFVMGDNEWREAHSWPPRDTSRESLCLARDVHEIHGVLGPCAQASAERSSSFAADPQHPVTDAYDDYGPHDYSALTSRTDVLTFDSEELENDVTVAGTVVARLFASCDCRDFDLWVRLLDVYPDGRAFNLMAPGSDVLRASYRERARGKQLLEPGSVYELNLDGLQTAITFKVGHRIRVQISASFGPYMSRNLQTGESEATSSETAVAGITIHHSDAHRSSVMLPVLDPGE